MTDVNKCTSSSNFVWLVKSLYICPYLSYESGIIGKPSFVRTVHLKHLPSTYERHMSSQRKYYISINPYSAEILYLYLHSPGPVLILQDDNAGPHRFSQGYYKLTSERDCGENSCLPRVQTSTPTEHLWDLLKCAVSCQGDQRNQRGKPATNPGWGMGCHLTDSCDQAGDQHEEELCFDRIQISLRLLWLLILLTK